jgi:NADPH:quinone reductase-like Zn-dependent oxidoreductase
MKAAVYKKYGPPEVLEVIEVPDLKPKPNEVLIKVRATTVTSGDVRLRKADPFIARLFTGLFKPNAKSMILGSDLSGVVEAVGSEVKLFKKGDQVLGTTGGFGAYGEYVALPETAVLAYKPENLSFEEAAALFFGGHTALHFLQKKGQIKAGQKVLIYGASGSVGTFAVQLAKYFGAEVTAVCSFSNLELVRSLGADQVIDYTKEDFTQTKERFDLIFETVGKTKLKDCVKLLKKAGVYLGTVHISLGKILQGIWINLTSKKKVIGGVASEHQEDAKFLAELAEKKFIKPVIDQVFSLAEITKAHVYVEKGHKKGNVVIKINS